MEGAWTPGSAYTSPRLKSSPQCSLPSRSSPSAIDAAGRRTSVSALTTSCGRRSAFPARRATACWPPAPASRPALPLQPWSLRSRIYGGVHHDPRFRSCNLVIGWTVVWCSSRLFAGLDGSQSRHKYYEGTKVRRYSRFIAAKIKKYRSWYSSCERHYEFMQT